MSDVQVYSLGLINASVCAPKDMDRADVELAVNTSDPTGIDSRWTISEDETFASGQPMPCPCEQNPATRLHWLLRC